MYSPIWILLHARGLGNGFPGETDDAADLGAITADLGAITASINYAFKISIEYKFRNRQ